MGGREMGGEMRTLARASLSTRPRRGSRAPRSISASKSGCSAVHSPATCGVNLEGGVCERGAMEGCVREERGWRRGV